MKVNVLSDQLTLFNGFHAQKNCPHILRRVAVWDEDEEEETLLLTNPLGFGPTIIAAFYKERWKIEFLFKALLKPNLKVKAFVGTTQNALYVQICTTLIVMLIIQHIKSRSGRQSLQLSC